MRQSIRVGSASFLLYLFYALFSAYVMPRLFAHMVEIITMNSEVPWATPLEPTMSNIAQSCYMTLSVGVALVFALSGENAYFRRHYLQALLIGGLVLIATGIADLMLSAAGLGSLLEPFRNAYRLLVDSEVAGGTKRVVGLMPEASAYGSTCLGAVANLVFLRPCFESARLRNYIVPFTILGLLAMVALSTSSAGYVGLAVFAVVYTANWLRRAMSPDAPQREAIKSEAIFALSATLVFLAVLALTPHALDSVFDLIDGMVFHKTEVGFLCRADHVDEGGGGRLFHNEWVRGWPWLRADIELVCEHFEQHRHHRSGASGFFHPASLLAALPCRGPANKGIGIGVKIRHATTISDYGACRDHA